MQSRIKIVYTVPNQLINVNWQILLQKKKLAHVFTVYNVCVINYVKFDFKYMDDITTHVL